MESRPAVAPAQGPPAAGRTKVPRGWGTAIGLLVAAIVLVGLAAPFAVAQHVRTEAATYDMAKTDAIVVLGAAQYDGKPSPVFANRLDHAHELYEEGVAPRIITVGGKQPGDSYTEAEAGKNYLVDQGVPADAVVEVSEGEDTVGSLAGVANVMEQQGWHSITIVSDPAHVARTAAIARSYGIQPHGHPTQEGAGSQITAEYVARETLAYLHFVTMQQWEIPRVVTSGSG